MFETAIALIIVLAAVLWAGRSLWRTAEGKGGCAGCRGCGSADTACAGSDAPGLEKRSDPSTRDKIDKPSPRDISAAPGPAGE